MVPVTIYCYEINFIVTSKSRTYKKQLIVMDQLWHLVRYPKRKGIPVECVDTHSLRGGGANALALSGYSETAIQKMGRWKWATFKEYIREELANYADGMSTAMKTKFNFMNVAGNAFRDITETVLTMEYNTEFNHAGAA